MKKLMILIMFMFSLNSFASDLAPTEKDITEITNFVKIFVNKPTKLCPEEFPAEMRVNLAGELDKRSSLYSLLKGDVYVRCPGRVEWSKSEECLFMQCKEASDFCDTPGEWTLEICDNSF